jgi:hypothetical protein
VLYPESPLRSPKEGNHEELNDLEKRLEQIGNAYTLNLILLPDGLVGTLEKTGDTNVGGPV